MRHSRSLTSRKVALKADAYSCLSATPVKDGTGIGVRAERKLTVDDIVDDIPNRVAFCQSISFGHLYAGLYSYNQETLGR